MNRGQQQNNTKVQMNQIKKKIIKKEIHHIIQYPMFPYNIFLNFNFYNIPPPPFFQSIIKKKETNWMDKIPILVGVDEMHSRDSCAICLQEMNEKKIIKILKCNHFFHHECLIQWLHRKMECPVCRDLIQNNK